MPTDQPNADAICLLGIGGLDPSGGAGLPADGRAAAAFGVHLCPIATAVIAQNTRGVTAISVVSPQLLATQLDVLLEDVTVAAIKIGALPSVAAVEVVARTLGRLGGLPVVLDTVFAPSSGLQFSDDATIGAIKEQLFPLCELLTPNIPETERLTGIRVTDLASASEAAALLRSWGAAHVLIKGGHGADLLHATDWLISPNATCELTAPRIPNAQVRGTGCLLASAIAAQRARAVPLQQAVAVAKPWLAGAIAGAAAIGGGRRVAVRVPVTGSGLG